MVEWWVLSELAGDDLLIHGLKNPSLNQPVALGTRGLGHCSYAALDIKVNMSGPNLWVFLNLFDISKKFCIFLYLYIYIYIILYIGYFDICLYMSLHFRAHFPFLVAHFVRGIFFSMSMIRRLLDAVERSGSTTTISLSSSPCSAWRKKQKGAREITEFCGHLIYFDIIWFIWCFNRIQVWNKLIFLGRTAKPFFPFDFRIFTHWKGPCQAGGADSPGLLCIRPAGRCSIPVELEPPWGCGSYTWPVAMWIVYPAYVHGTKIFAGRGRGWRL